MKLMRIVKSLLALTTLMAGLPLAGQVESVDDMYFEPDSITKPYKPTGKNFAFIRSKRSGGVAHTSKADSILALPINEIVLVFTESTSSAIANREEANRDRWENLLKTYPEFFQHNATLYNMCQCNTRGDTAAFRKMQGFYIYFESDQPVAEEPAPPVKSAPEVKKPKDEEMASAKKPEKKKEEREIEKTEDEPRKEKVREKEKEKPEAREEKKEAVDISTMDIPREKPKKKTGYTKPRKALDPKGCRPPCYENGDEDLNLFFKENITLSKKQRRHGKNLMSTVRLQLNFDGSIKKAMVAGTDQNLNQLVDDAVKRMNLWNPAVKNGLTVKSDVMITLKYDKESKSMQPSEVRITPRPAPKCNKCISDFEMFGSD